MCLGDGVLSNVLLIYYLICFSLKTVIHGIDPFVGLKVVAAEVFLLFVCCRGILVVV